MNSLNASFTFVAHCNVKVSELELHTRHVVMTKMRISIHKTVNTCVSLMSRMVLILCYPSNLGQMWLLFLPLRLYGVEYRVGIVVSILRTSIFECWCRHAKRTIRFGNTLASTCECTVLWLVGLLRRIILLEVPNLCLPKIGDTCRARIFQYLLVVQDASGSSRRLCVNLYFWWVLYFL